MKRIISLAAILLLILTACQFKPYSVTGNRITVRIKSPAKGQAKTMMVQIVNDRIIRVSATDGNKIPDVKSLMAVERPEESQDFTCKQEDDRLLVSTPALRMHISLKTGEITFSDSTGKLILAENKGGGKTFTPVTISDKKSKAIRQVFESPDNESLYGLGENQTSFLNLKGRDADLFQYNTVAVIPFIVSDRNFGILWDNNSQTKFGDPREFEELSTMKVYDRNGQPGGLTATYRLKDDTAKVLFTRTEKEVSYQFLRDMKKFPQGFKLSQELITWEGFLEADTTGDQKLLFTSAGYARLWIDGKLVADRWRQCWNTITTRLYLPMEAGKKYPVKIEWKPDGDESYIALKHLNPMPAGEQGKISFASESADMLNYYFIYGKNMDDVISGYRTLTGKANLMPKWAMGFWQSRERYKTQDEIISTVAEFRKRGIPIDNIVLDWFYWEEDKWGDHKFDPKRFPDPDKMIRILHDSLNAHFMISVWPKFYVGTENYKAMDSKGWLYRKNVENNQKDWVGPGYVSTFYDAFNADAREFYWGDINKKLFSKGVDAWWLDASEPDILSNMAPEERKALMHPTALGPAASYFNAYPLVHAGGVYDGQRKVNPDQRVFILTRSAFAGMQRYAAATWSGDIAATWHDMKTQIPAGLSFSISGMPYWTMDIGGFAVESRYYDAKGETLEEWREQMTRWLQFGAFCPLFRVHGQYPFREIFNVAPENHPAYQAMVAADKLRYRLMPYIYSIAASTYFDNYTMMRPLIMDFSNDKAVNNIKDQFMFGPQLLINPVCEYKARSRQVYLPAGNGWYDLFTGSYSEGGKEIKAEAPLNHIPVFVREGAILPVGPDIQYATQPSESPVTLFVYAGKNGNFTLYEDEAINYNYEKGIYSKISFSYDDASHSLTIGDRAGEFPGMQKERIFQIVLVKKGKSANPAGSFKPDASIRYSGKAMTIKL